VKQAVSEVCETMHGQESSIQYFVDGALAYHRVSLQSREEVFMPNACPFCGIPQEQYVLSNTTCYAIFDLSPVAPGHMLVIPKRHAPTFFDLTTQEHQDMDDLLLRCKEQLDQSSTPGGYNIGLNCGTIAGQSILHCHCHLIPRYQGDVQDPKGGVRGVIPNKQHY
jgi:diadenosine tetraphosphate (Ap4A) HIT family hydrolase